MIKFERFVLTNGLRVLVHEDHATPMAVVNVMYDVGARDEDPSRTGFAHLFEHLMFGGSVNVPDFDSPLQRAGGENNAYTTNDLTNYYCQLPAENIETAFWLESDRMMSLAFSKKSLEVQRKVVCEEFREHYLNKPYGDAGQKLRSLAYKVHPYRWLTIGEKLEHIEQAKLEDVKEFFFRYYRPVNAILVVAGHIKTAEALRLAEKWFGGIEAGERLERRLPAEPKQHAARETEASAAVPLDAYYKAWHMPGRTQSGYHEADIASEILGGGSSSRLHQRLVKELRLFSNIDCHHHGSLDPGLMMIEGKLVAGVAPKTAEDAVEEVLLRFTQEEVQERELQKAKNKTESLIAFEDMTTMSRAGSLAFYELIGDAEGINSELDKYNGVTAASLLEQSRRIFAPSNGNLLRYLGNANNRSN